MTDISLRRVTAALAKLVLPFSPRMYWELRADDIHERWRDDSHDSELIASLLDRLKPHTVLDVGCGSGRLFPLFLRHGVTTVVGQDVSRWALRRARRQFAFPGLSLVHRRIDQLDYPPGHFDLGVCNRALSAIPPHDISAAIKRLALLCRHLYLNEYSESDGGEPAPYWFLHDYFAHLSRHAKYTVLETGRLGRETYHLVRIDSR